MAALARLCRDASLEIPGDKMMTTYYTFFDSPLQPILLCSDGEALTGLFLVEHKHGPEIGPDWERCDDAAPFAEAKRQLSDYFAGTLTQFDLPVALQGTE